MHAVMSGAFDHIRYGNAWQLDVNDSGWASPLDVAASTQGELRAWLAQRSKGSSNCFSQAVESLPQQSSARSPPCGNRRRTSASHELHSESLPRSLPHPRKKTRSPHSHLSPSSCLREPLSRTIDPQHPGARLRSPHRSHPPSKKRASTSPSGDTPPQSPAPTQKS